MYEPAGVDLTWYHSLYDPLQTEKTLCREQQLTKLVPWLRGRFGATTSSTGEFERCARSLLALTGTTDDPATGTSTIGRDLDPQFKKTALRQGFLPEV